MAARGDRVGLWLCALLLLLPFCYGNTASSPVFLFGSSSAHLATPGSEKSSGSVSYQVRS